LVLAWLAERAFDSVSWDASTGRLRATASPQDFLGMASQLGSTPPGDVRYEDEAQRCVPRSDARYAMRVAAEEDRVEFERCWIVMRSAAVTQRMNAMIQSGQLTPAVKAVLCELEFYLRFGILTKGTVIPKRALGDVPLENLRTRLSASGSDELKTLFAVAEHLAALARTFAAQER
jgi:hypothetical protein